MINHFCSKLANISYLFYSEEMTFFLQNSPDVPKQLNEVTPQSYENLLKIYSSVFTDFDENFDTHEGKIVQEKFLKALIAAYPHSRAFRDLVKICKEKFVAKQDTNLLIINMFSIYEKETVKEYSNMNEGKLVFFNMKNIELCKNISNVQENVANFYDKLYDSLNQDMLETEAMIVGLTSLKGLQEQYDKLAKSPSMKTAQLASCRRGRVKLYQCLVLIVGKRILIILQMKRRDMRRNLNVLDK